MKIEIQVQYFKGRDWGSASLVDSRMCQGWGLRSTLWVEAADSCNSSLSHESLLVCVCPSLRPSSFGRVISGLFSHFTCHSLQTDCVFLYLGIFNIQSIIGTQYIFKQIPQRNKIMKWRTYEEFCQHLNEVKCIKNTRMITNTHTYSCTHTYRDTTLE